MGQAKGNIKKYFVEIEGIVDAKKEDIERVSPFYAFINDAEGTNEVLNRYTKERRLEIEQILRYRDPAERIEIIKKNIRDKDHKELVANIRKLLIYDTAVEKYGITKSLKERERHKNFVELCIKEVGTKEKVEILKKIDEINLLSKVTSARIKQNAYHECDDLMNEYGRELSEICFKNIEYSSVLSMLQLELDYYKDNNEPTINSHFCREEAFKLKELLDKDEPFYVYRGTNIGKDDRIRMGSKESGADYYKQDAGTGVSYSLDRNTAGFFCFFNLKDKETEDILSKNKIRNVPKELWSKEEFCEFWSETIDMMIDKKQIQPIICKHLIEPKKIKGSNFGKSEYEVNIMPEDTIVVDYKLVKGRKIAECVWEVLNKRQKNTLNTEGGFDKDKIVVFTYEYNGKAYQLFADGADVGDAVNQEKTNAIKTGFGLDADKIREIFEKNAIQLPKRFSPQKLTKEFWDFIRRRPSSKWKENGQAYLIKNQ